MKAPPLLLRFARFDGFGFARALLAALPAIIAAVSLLVVV
jgi:hypothetical protein